MIDDGHIDERDFGRRGGDDSPPIFNGVQDQPYRRGTLTSDGRTASEQYMRFLQKHKEVRDGRE